jgi:hypothetical protein
MNRALLYALAAAGVPVLAVSGCDPNWRADDGPLGRMTIRGLEVRPTVGPEFNTQLMPRRLQGAFEIGLAGPGEEGIVSHGIGGACLVAQIPMWGKPCKTSTTCNFLARASGDRFAAEEMWEGYCVKAPSEKRNPDSVGQCWVRPGSTRDFCERSIDHDNQPWAPGRHALPAVDTSIVYSYLDAAHRSLNPGLAWRVLPCLSPFDWKTGVEQFACRNPDDPRALTPPGPVTRVP